MFMKKLIIGAVGGVLVGLGAGFFAGRELTRRRLGAEYDERLEHELNATKVYLNNKFKDQVLVSINEGMLEDSQTEEEVDGARGVSNETMERVIRGLKYGLTVEAKPALAARNVFLGKPSSEDDEDYTEEDSKRTLDSPYVISHNEYMEGSLDYSQVTLTYFAEDDTLVDETDMPVENPDRVVGNVNLDKFGHRSNDPRTVYIRNEKLAADYEVLLHDGSFGEVVHGQISDPRRKASSRKMRKE